MVKRLLLAIEFPHVDNINLADEQQLRKLILWLEENVIKKWDKNELQRSINSSEWPNLYGKYKSLLGCPTLANTLEEVEWILGYAVQQEYAKKGDVYIKHAVENLKSINVPNVIAENPLDKLDLHSQESVEGITNLCKMLKLSQHPDPLVNLKAISKVVNTRLTTHALANPQEYIIKGTTFPFQDLNLGFELGDPVLNRAAKILRLIYIHNLRELQTKANELIVAVQSVTANPKTDTKLGKVGR